VRDTAAWVADLAFIALCVATMGYCLGGRLSSMMAGQSDADANISHYAFARVGGVHWDGRSAAIANGRSAEMLDAALG
jgi:dienelactone hydrolase